MTTKAGLRRRSSQHDVADLEDVLDDNNEAASERAMEPRLEAIRAATATDASDATKAAGANACRPRLAALEVKPGQPLASPPPNAIEARSR